MNNLINTSCINDTNTLIFVSPANNRQADEDYN